MSAEKKIYLASTVIERKMRNVFEVALRGRSPDPIIASVQWQWRRNLISLA